VTFKTYVPRRKTPFLQGFAAGPQEYLRYTATFSALLTRNLILAKLSGELSATRDSALDRMLPPGLHTGLGLE